MGFASTCAGSDMVWAGQQSHTSKRLQAASTGASELNVCSAAPLKAAGKQELAQAAP
jgi:hypothetical protein